MGHVGLLLGSEQTRLLIQIMELIGQLYLVHQVFLHQRVKLLPGMEVRLLLQGMGRRIMSLLHQMVLLGQEGDY